MSLAENDSRKIDAEPIVTSPYTSIWNAWNTIVQDGMCPPGWVDDSDFESMLFNVSRLDFENLLANAGTMVNKRKQVTDIYMDTEEKILAQAGTALRLRTSNGASMLDITRVKKREIVKQTQRYRLPHVVEDEYETRLQEDGLVILERRRKIVESAVAEVNGKPVKISFKVYANPDLSNVIEIESTQGQTVLEAAVQWGIPVEHLATFSYAEHVHRTQGGNTLIDTRPLL